MHNVRLTMKQGTPIRRLGKVLAWIAVACIAGVLSVMFWGFLGLALVLIPIVGIGVMIRAIVLELCGKRPTYTAGVADLSGIPTKPKRFRHFGTEIPNDRDEN